MRIPWKQIGRTAWEWAVLLIRATATKDTPPVAPPMPPQERPEEPR